MGTQSLKSYGTQLAITLVALVLALKVLGSLKQDGDTIQWQFGTGGSSDGSSDD